MIMENKTPNFSVLIPVYIKEDPSFFHKCLKSINDQTLKADEIIICIDNIISEELDLVIKNFSEDLNIKKIAYQGKDQLGGSLAMGVERCKNRLIFRMDADDICDKNRFKIMMDHFLVKNLDVLGCWTKEFNCHIHDLNRVRKTPSKVTKENSNIRNPFNHPSVLFKKSSVMKAGNYKPCKSFEDWYLWLRMIKLEMKMENLEDILVYQRVGNNFESRRSGMNYINNEIEALNLWRKEKLITNITFLLSIAIRLFSRMLPQSLLALVYSIFLRSKTNKKTGRDNAEK